MQSTLDLAIHEIMQSILHEDATTYQFLHYSKEKYQQKIVEKTGIEKRNQEKYIQFDGIDSYYVGGGYDLDINTHKDLSPPHDGKGGHGQEAKAFKKGTI